MFNRRWQDDRRRFQRLSVNLTVTYRVDGPLYVRRMFGTSEVEAVTLDLGRGGMAILAKSNIPVWATLVLKFMLFKTDKKGVVSFSDPVEVIGEVRSCLPVEDNYYRLGICFKEIREQHKQEISGFVSLTSQP